MKKIINKPENYVDEALEGMVRAHPGSFKRGGASGRVILRDQATAPGKVGLASGGGFGHLPLFCGYVGEGLLDGCAVGDVFAGPAYDDVIATLRAADTGAGVLSVIGNYGGDKMVFAMASEALEAEGIATETVIVSDDVASAPAESAQTRRGVAGMIFAFKIAGAAAQSGANLGEVAAVARRAVENCRSIGVALSPCLLPQVGKPSFDLDSGTIEMGMGIHGEQGIWRGPMKSADELADEMLERLLAEDVFQKGDRIAVLCNSLGATPLEELYIFYRRLDQNLAALGVDVSFPLIGHFATSMEMAGASLSLLKLDDELADFLGAPSNCPNWR